MAVHIHITGPAGAGITTLGAALARTQNLRHLDTDDFLWLPSDPPYQDLVPAATRLQMLRIAFEDAAQQGWVLSGSLSGWGDPLIPQFDAVLYVYAPAAVRLDRLRRREAAKFGARIQPGGIMHAGHLDFLAWAAAYDNPAMTGRSQHEHEAWLARLTCPVLRLDGEAPTADQLRQTGLFLAGL